MQRSGNHLENADTMGERIGRIWQIETDFFDFFAENPYIELKKNLFQSAKSAQSVLPLYRHFLKRKQ
jgi:hypothetical protein